MKDRRRNTDENLRDLERQVASGDEVALERLIAARHRAGIPVARDRVEALLAQEIGNPREITDSPLNDLAHIARAVAWTVSAPVPELTFDGRPWAWEELSSGSVLVVRNRRGQVIIGIHAPDPASDWSVRWRRSMISAIRFHLRTALARSLERDLDEGARAARARLLPNTPGHPGTSWPELAYPAGIPAWAAPTLAAELREDPARLLEVQRNDACFWDRRKRHSYSWRDLTPVIARWADTASEDRLVLSESEARWFVREVYGFDLSSYAEVMQILSSGLPIPQARNSEGRIAGYPALNEVSLLQGVMPPVEQGLLPENAAGCGWADWAARRLVQILSVRRVSGKDISVSIGGALDLEHTPVQQEDSRRSNLEESSEVVARRRVLVYFKGSVGRTTTRSRRSAWERIQDKSIEVSISFPLNMKPTPWGGDTIYPEGEFFLSTGHGRYGQPAYGGRERDHAPYGFQALAELIEKVILEFFPGATIRSYWHW